jgi:hypothetical protein
VKGEIMSFIKDIKSQGFGYAVGEAMEKIYSFFGVAPVKELEDLCPGKDFEKDFGFYLKAYIERKNR